MVEVFKTNVSNSTQAGMLIEKIHTSFQHYQANFDLQDCDRVLRVKSAKGPVQSSILIGLLNEHGFQAEILPDEMPLSSNPLLKFRFLAHNR